MLSQIGRVVMAHPLVGKLARVTAIRREPDHPDTGKTFTISDVEMPLNRELTGETAHIRMPKPANRTPEHVECAYLFPDEVEVLMGVECMFTSSDSLGWVSAVKLLKD